MKELEYTILTAEKSGIFTIYSPELSVIKSGANIQECYDEIIVDITKKKALFSENGITLSQKSTTAKKKTADLSIFSKKWLIYFTVLLSIILISIALTGMAFNQVFIHRYMRLERKVLETINPTQLKQQERIQRFKTNLKAISPYIKEIKKVSKEESK